ncbi:glycoside hydrolase family 10 protein [Fictibacillus terranigra]|uniref:Family 10 glycosylhydrolase n=1 Tax=Fictibacillus terranigra TaxID=3058424 RepID=A0ABT8EAN9_9BACL|nr:family 10 glycosylhydrolase [Fictibacillus sp. CENA-BCM004]MDN4074965.1 family 10 glycosylhydrolase [Fictibacillus sp. CENA-BCM004]
MVCRKKAVSLWLAALIGGNLLLSPQDAFAEKSPHHAQTLYPKQELRAAWIASVTNIDWPSKPGLSIAQQKEEFTRFLDEQKAMNMNAVVMQIKPTADAFYPSQYGLWSKYLTGVQGKDPGYDPLSFMVEEAHKRNLEFHAWFNPYRITMPLGKTAGLSDLNKLPADHPARQHPDWVVPYGQQLYFNPGIPEAQQFIIDGILEVVQHYDIDAVHMDDYFYPYKIAGVPFPDQSTYEAYGKTRFSDIDDWRRDNVNQLVKHLNETIKSEKSYVKFGISPFGVWRNKAVDPTGSDTAAGQTNYDDLYADTRTWINNGYIDYIAPQIYWNIGLPVADYAKLLDWWAKEVRGKNVQLYIGQADYKINTITNGVSNWLNPEEMPNQLKLNRTYGDFKGSMHFSAKDLRKNPLGIADRLQNDIYKYPSLIPPMPWIDDQTPKAPKIRRIQVNNNEVSFAIEKHNKHSDATAYAVYRFNGKKSGNIEDPAHLLTTVYSPKKRYLFSDKTIESGKAYTYLVTALDRTHNESKPSKRIRVDTEK